MAMKMSVLLAVLWISGCGSAAIVNNPSPFHAAASSDATEQAILDALPLHGWSTEDVTPGRILAFLSIRSHLLRCEITYDEREVRIAYFASDRLDAERTRNGGWSAHPNVNRWMSELAQDIEESIRKVSAGVLPSD